MYQTIQCLAADKESDVKNFFLDVKLNDSLQYSLNDSLHSTVQQDVSMEIASDKNSPELPIVNPTSHIVPDSPNEKQTTVTSAMPAYEQEHEHQDDDDDDDEEDEIIDKTKIDKLKIVNLENEMDDEMDIIIESKAEIGHLNKDEESCNSEDFEASNKNSSNA